MSPAEGSILPIFYDHSSRRATLTYWPAKEVTPGGPQSIIELCKRAGLSQCFGVSTNFHTFLEAWKGCKDAGLHFCFGLELVMCNDAKLHTEESRASEHKIIVFMRNTAGYEDLIKLYTACHGNAENKYYRQRFDYPQLNALWTDNLLLAVPFFDSFLHRNILGYGSHIVPHMPVNPILFREVATGVPFASLIDAALDNYCRAGDHEQVRTKTIYYEKREDFAAYITYRAIQARTTFNVPNMDFMCSPRFCFEEWEELQAA